MFPRSKRSEEADGLRRNAPRHLSDPADEKMSGTEAVLGQDATRRGRKREHAARLARAFGVQDDAKRHPRSLSGDAADAAREPDASKRLAVLAERPRRFSGARTVRLAGRCDPISRRLR